MRISKALSHIYEMRPHFVRIASRADREIALGAGREKEVERVTLPKLLRLLF